MPGPAAKEPDSERGVEPCSGLRSHNDMPDAALQASHTLEIEAEAAPPHGAQDAATFGADDEEVSLSRPARGLVSQRVSAFAQLSLSRSTMGSQSAGPYDESMPDQGMVSERIRQHQHFISSLASRPPRKVI